MWASSRRWRAWMKCSAPPVNLQSGSRWNAPRAKEAAWGAKLQHLAEIFQRVTRSERLGVCLDTAHLFEAGHDLRTPGGWDTIIGELDELVGINQVLAFHLNDSKTDLGSRVDRHEHIGKGKIGREPFRHIVNDTRFPVIPGCLETPKSKDLHEDRENLAVLRALRG